jgi:putative intracellular protease/amidase
MRKIVFIIPPAVELLDLAGPMQVFSEANFHGLKVQLEYYSIQPNTAS